MVNTTVAEVQSTIVRGPHRNEDFFVVRERKHRQTVATAIQLKPRSTPRGLRAHPRGRIS